LIDSLPPPLTPFDPATMLEGIDERGVGLRIVFFRLPDRLAHVIAAVKRSGSIDESVTPLLWSREGTDADLWPASPPLQSLSIERRTDSGVALLVGMAGRSHWSLSVEARSGATHVEFDAACRTGGENSWLGSSYQAADPAWAWLRGENPQHHTLVTPLGPLHLRATRGMLSQAAENRLSFMPDSGGTVQPRRWTYVFDFVFELEPADESGSPADHNVH
jgi:hypothetical protein